MREIHLAGRAFVYIELGDTELRTATSLSPIRKFACSTICGLLGRQMLGAGSRPMGDGRDRAKASLASVSEHLKIWMSRRVHWWFAYNDTRRAR